MYSAEELADYYPQIVVLNAENGIKQIYNVDNPPPIA
jgi:aspartate 1-decarboxylase